MEPADVAHPTPTWDFLRMALWIANDQAKDDNQIDIDAKELEMELKEGDQREDENSKLETPKL